MSCCGQGRSGLGVRVEGTVSTAGVGVVIFEYVGRTALTAIGATGRRYRFEEPGARMTVDARDRAALDRSPVLQQVG